MLVVGYVDGDIILWNLPTAVSANNQKGNKASNDAVKLKLYSGDRRLPVIVLHWSNSPLSGSAGQVFVYGGDFVVVAGGWVVMMSLQRWWVGGYGGNRWRWWKEAVVVVVVSVVEGGCGFSLGGRRLWFQVVVEGGLWMWWDE
ncbi:hypothetical protein HanXRQr2_Chr15g0720061 [Helianthus annuus]|uniref:Uncharacterized protein n=1 Tax=Helianthus annuus TaxID=4232 RepID=A0A9K3E682_HELAN|nr:hypothetical protein HanXRQr2_Chr15g0720061 [Helianthus annuus]KAJ0453167.1 hypothetical protein HanHA300_Chr15g0587271 [Helianthus annuus]KAJ0475084.1 hypothetical protein HanHA89_Chr15g0637081 [Helianthus annuus]KAJ0650640.1 hypothetical protein HanLR1_Chr15g0598001 [Helianthus annuus]KAJ0833468.1 hypothetical protein HanPSC8_Chr15g0690711 [Helianthus annuus]